MIRTIIFGVFMALAQAAQAQIVVIGHPSAAPLTAEQVSYLFLGKVQSATPVGPARGAAPARRVLPQGHWKRALAGEGAVGSSGLLGEGATPS
jgi:hypothetical protein